MKPYKRRNFFIKKDFQGKLILGYFLLVTGGCLLFIFILGIFSSDTMTISYSNHDLLVGQTPLMLFKNIITAHWLFLVIITLFLVLVSMMITHRIAGPLYRFERTLDSMVQKDLSETIYLRKKDEGKELAQKINSFNDDLSQTFKNSQELLGLKLAIQEELEKIVLQEAELSPENLEHVKDLLRNLQEKNEKMGSIFSSYTLKDE